MGKHLQESNIKTINGESLIGPGNLDLGTMSEPGYGLSLDEDGKIQLGYSIQEDGYTIRALDVGSNLQIALSEGGAGIFLAQGGGHTNIIMISEQGVIGFAENSAILQSDTRVNIAYSNPNTNNSCSIKTLKKSDESNREGVQFLYESGRFKFKSGYPESKVKVIDGSPNEIAVRDNLIKVVDFHEYSEESDSLQVYMSENMDIGDTIFLAYSTVILGREIRNVTIKKIEDNQFLIEYTEEGISQLNREVFSFG